MDHRLTRREALALPVSLLAAADGWNAGQVRHLLPGANHERFLIKASFASPLRGRPALTVDGKRKIEAVRTDSKGSFWSFDVAGLRPLTSYRLRIVDHSGKPLCGEWPLRTFPEPASSQQRFRLLIYTCAGGHDGTRILGTDQPYWVSIANRRKMLAKGLSLQPDAVIANGDHVYWDLRVGPGPLQLGASEWAKREIGEFRRDIPVHGTPNENVLHRAVGPQIADLYGTMFRSAPMLFLQDDHDHFENDEARPGEGITYPPDDFMLRLARATQRMYYPEFLPDGDRPAALPGASLPGLADGCGESYGTLRWGNLAEILLYDCRRGLTLKGPMAGFVPDDVEAWLTRRMKESACGHVVNVPSTPIAWSAGKWGEWYADLLEPGGKLGVSKPKYFWQEGWRSQHDRLLRACSNMERIPLFVSGDLHALGQGRIVRNGSMDLRRNPVHSILSGPISTGPKAWPSAWRGTPPQVPTGLEVEAQLPPLEDNGFTLMDFHPDKIEFQMFHWKIGRPEAELDNLQPFHRFTLTRRI